MGLVQILVIWGLATASPFSFSQEEVTKGNTRTPYQPPPWIAKMARPQSVHSSEVDEFIIGGLQDRPPWYGVPAKSNSKYACKPEKNSQGVLVWQFCDM